MSVAPYVGPGDAPTLVALGDSITYQAQSLGTTQGPIRDVLNAAGWRVSWNGWPGHEWAHHTADLTEASATAPDVALLLFGTNDALRYPYSGDRHGGGEALVWRAVRWAETFRAACPATAVVLMTLNECTLDAGSNWLSPIVNEYLRIRCPRVEGPPVALLDWAGVVDRAKDTGEDVLDKYALHPNALGRERWRDALLAALAEATGGTP